MVYEGKEIKERSKGNRIGKTLSQVFLQQIVTGYGKRVSIHPVDMWIHPFQKWIVQIIPLEGAKDRRQTERMFRRIIHLNTCKCTVQGFSLEFYCT